MSKFCAQIHLTLILIVSLYSWAQAETLLMPVPVHNIGSGESFASSGFTQKAFEVSAVAKANFINSVEQLQGMQSTQILAAGKPVPISAVQKTSDVHKGKNTQALFSADGIQIQGVLVPMSDGSAGQTLHCKNPQSGLIVDAVVLADGNLEVTSQ